MRLFFFLNKHVMRLVMLTMGKGLKGYKLNRVSFQCQGGLFDKDVYL